MKNENGKLTGVWYEFGSERFRRRDSAIAAAEWAIKEEMAAEWLKTESDNRLIDYGVWTREAIEPCGSIALLGWGKTSDSNGAVSDLDSNFRRTIYRVDYDNPSRGIYVAKRWTETEFNRWQTFSPWDGADSVPVTREEWHYSGLFFFMRRYCNSDWSIPGFATELNSRWDRAACDLDRNEVAEIVLAARELGRVPSFHELLSLNPELLERSEELARIREAVG